ncbi:MAG: outer membrane homotrimeric porin [Mailhella sp.]|nr:outer membrane homotrimeric porin [Mailhella sp.]
MKKLTTLVLAAGLVVSAFAGSASAGEFKPVLQFAEEFSYGDAGYKSQENFNATTRIRFGFDYVASEDLSATILFQYGGYSWGTNNDAKFTRDPDADLRMRLAYIDWTLPNTDVKVRMGRQAVVAPSYAFGSAVLDGRADAVSVNGNINENISLGFAWMRLDSSSSDKYKNGSLQAPDDDADALMLNAEFAYDGFKVAPWAVYAHKQRKAKSGIMPFEHEDVKKEIDLSGFTKNGLDPVADLYIIGASAELNMFDPFVFAVDALYSNVTYHNVQDSEYYDDSLDAYYVAAKGSYKFSNGVASLGGWYSNGLELRENHKFDNAFVVLDGGFSASSVLFDGNVVGGDEFTNVANGGLDSPFGTWGLIAEYAGFSFLENLSHTARILYVEGTSKIDNNSNRSLTYRTDRTDVFSRSYFLTEDDSAIEIDFDTTYQIYKNLSATLQLGYVFFDQSNLAAGEEEADDIFRSALTFVYKF